MSSRYHRCGGKVKKNKRRIECKKYFNQGYAMQLEKHYKTSIKNFRRSYKKIIKKNYLDIVSNSVNCKITPINKK